MVDSASVFYSMVGIPEWHFSTHLPPTTCAGLFKGMGEGLLSVSRIGEPKDWRSCSISTSSHFKNDAKRLPYATERLDQNFIQYPLPSKASAYKFLNLGLRLQYNRGTENSEVNCVVLMYIIEFSHFRCKIFVFRNHVASGSRIWSLVFLLLTLFWKGQNGEIVEHKA